MQLALIDIDGVLANDEHRVQHALNREWAIYFAPARMKQDSPLQGGRELIQRLIREGWEIQYLTGRREDRRAVTTLWLIEHGFPIAPIHMRGRQEKMPLANFKKMRIQEMLETGLYDEIVLHDDDPEVIRLVKETFGDDYGVHCTWYIKKEAMVKKAIA